MKSLWGGILIGLLLAGCMIGGGDMPFVYSDSYLRAKKEPEALIRAVHDHNALPPETFSRLDQYPDRYVKRMLAENPSCPPELLAKYAGDPDYYIRRGVARNRNAPYELLQKLSGDPNWQVLNSIAGNPLIKDDIVDKLMNHPDSMVHNALAANRALPASRLEELYERYHSDQYINSYFADNPNTPEKIIRRIWEFEKTNQEYVTCICLAKNPGVPQDILLDMYHRKVNIRLSFYAQNPNCPEEIRQAIGKSDDTGAKESLRSTLSRAH